VFYVAVDDRILANYHADHEWVPVDDPAFDKALYVPETGRSLSLQYLNTFKGFLGVFTGCLFYQFSNGQLDIDPARVVHYPPRNKTVQGYRFVWLQLVPDQSRHDQRDLGV